MLEFRTQGFQGYAVKYSPFFDNRIAVAAAANYGLVGNGRLYALELTPQGIVPVKVYPTQDALYDVTHSEAHSSHLLTASGDGSLRLYDTSLAPEFPIAKFEEHSREAFSCSWNLTSKATFASSSWDGTVKIWSPERQQSLLTLPTHSCTYSVQWSPHTDGMLSAVCSDSHLRVWDLRTPASASNHLILQIPIHAAPLSAGALAGKIQPTFPPAEALTHDWNKYRGSVVATAGVDRIIRTFDIRQPKGPLNMLQGHGYAVRKVAWSPHLPDLLLSASYDMTCRVWTDGGEQGGPARELGSMGRHTEFVTGVDWCLFGSEGWAASCGWDELLCVWDVRTVMHS
ncbi:uncharacterized protein Z519_05363 [Cladophialophora bantiana CBS 173.52]|uniref:Peroxin-7 n=1 Tax=Cladophialophora bantiana (strain ATCC 10958 / CBS 173.52 / CDC B-1940 / NIH 8579) TaxID=1442370 RepID=A0A0D2G636_CLAB1|nr:uncharacterized protein Z519_05363 [Cladophialophora bantiana CBS 173.52]KIW94047.1 hypothetical protein Z519_05363 [Cladophialophora bantiana CBS 173.52]